MGNDGGSNDERSNGGGSNDESSNDGGSNDEGSKLVMIEIVMMALSCRQ